MRKSDFQLIGIIGTVLGALFLASGVFTNIYYEVHQGIFGFTWVDYPYTKYSASLLVAGIVLLVIGLAFLWRAKQEVSPKSSPSPSQPPQSS